MIDLDFTIATNRLFIRPFQKSDFNNWLTQHNNRLPSQYKYDSGLSDMSVCTEEWFDSMIENQHQRMFEDKEYIFGVFRLTDGAHVGTLDLSTLMRYDFQWARLGYNLHNHFWGNGYGKESVEGVIQLGFEKLNFHRIEAHIDLDNAPSIKLAENVGMTFECVKKGFLFESGKWVDNLVYYKTADGV